MKKNNNNSLFLYTALIFVVAILLILISYFGQPHSGGVLVSPSPLPKEPISEKASALSDENLRLTSELSHLKEQNEEATKKLEIYQILATALSMKNKGEDQAAKKLLENFDIAVLDENQKELYNIINE